MSATEPQPGLELAAETAGRLPGVLPAQALRKAIADEWIHSDPYRIPPDSVQPASLDLRLGEFAWALRCSFLPDTSSTVEEKIAGIAFQKIDLRDGATLERDRPYLVPLIEGLALPDELRAKANPKSSTGRLDVFTRVITDGNPSFDEVPYGYHGKLYLEIVPRSFAIHVKTGLALNQLRLFTGDARLRDSEILEVHEEFPLLYLDSHALRGWELTVSDGLFLSVDLSGPTDRIVGYRAKRNSLPIDLGQIRGYGWRDFWEPVFPEAGSRIVLEPEIFYLLLSAEGACIPPGYAAEMTAYDPTAGELRTHYAGFFDPGFGYDVGGRRHGTRAALEVRARDVSFMVEHRQPICKLAFERMLEPPDVLYGEDLHSNYQGQETMLSKHFVEQTAGAGTTRQSVSSRSGETA
ncbi:MAG TPA: 2'-deoxycytidine 5'-triphosphate deaminase [Gaiellaceae bacterium]|jgi:dCTP deaminase|nr:2'-deoxycytidine 5'-triphosphate deaminase [Gaiellaceae bacterium]